VERRFCYEKSWHRAIIDSDFRVLTAWHCACGLSLAAEGKTAPGDQNRGTEVVMPLRNKICFIAVATAYLMVVLFVLAVMANAEEPANTAVQQQLGIFAPGEHQTNLMSVEPLIVDEEVVGSIASYVYQDVRTDRPVDYWELYDQDGELLALGWFDKFGIQRIAMDEGILTDEGKPDGTFVLVMDGDNI
jgi:hypothetical protein